MNRPRIAVLGSANIDLVCRVPHLPKPGETVRARSVARYRGGKGANQAVAAARLGADVRFYGMVGKDSFGDVLLAGFEENGVDAGAVEQCAARASGTATIWVSEDGENSIVIAEGANGQVDEAYVNRNLEAIAEADVLLVQFEVPVRTVSHLVRSLPESRPLIVLDPAPASGLDGFPIGRVNYLTPNKEELAALSGEVDSDAGVRKLLELGVGTVICTLGEEGAAVAELDAEAVRLPAFTVTAVDSTASGDAFSAALAVALAEGKGTDLREAVRFACAAGALAATREGAWPSLPTEEEVRALLRA